MEIKQHPWSRISLFWLFILLLIMVYIGLSQINVMIPTGVMHQPDAVLLEDQDALKGYLINTPGCRIPDMDPFDPAVKKFIHREKKPICNKGIPALFASNLNSVYLLNTSLPHYTEDIEELKCCYQPFYREQPKDDENDNKIRFNKKCIPFKVSTKISDEFIKLNCYINKSVVYTDFFSFVPIKIKKEIRETNIPNVLIIGIDAVSRLNFHRQMPKTVQYLKNMSAIELLGYNKVGDNTYPNLIPFLTGLTENELEKKCWNDKNKKKFDTCPFIWNDFKAKSYVTSFGEDASWMGIFNYQRKGFRKQPTDYMWGYFNRLSENEIGNSHNMNVYECIGGRLVYKEFLNYITNFVTKMNYEKLPYFGFYWGSSLSHDYLNKPEQGDETYYRFFKQLNDSAFLNNTVIIVMSDHGIRWGDIRQTYQGQLEERLPFSFLVLPQWFKTQYSEAYSNLLKNRRRLTTPFDLHETVKDVLNYSSLSHIFLQNRYKEKKRGYSLFNEISSERTCEDAEIASHWCTCQKSEEISTSDNIILGGANFVVDYINTKLESYAECAVLSLKNITHARVLTHSDKIVKSNNFKDYMVIIETVPGNGIFEVTVRNSKDDNKINYEVVGTISRLNLYGKQSACIIDFHLKLYCYCKSL